MNDKIGNFSLLSIRNCPFVNLMSHLIVIKHEQTRYSNSLKKIIFRMNFQKNRVGLYFD